MGDPDRPPEARHLFREHCRATPAPMSHLRIAGGIHQPSWERSPGSGPAERSQKETPGQGNDRNKCTLHAPPSATLKRSDSSDLYRRIELSDLGEELKVLGEAHAQPDPPPRMFDPHAVPPHDPSYLSDLTSCDDHPSSEPAELNRAAGADTCLVRSAKDVEPEPSEDRQPYGVKDPVVRVPHGVRQNAQEPDEREERDDCKKEVRVHPDPIDTETVWSIG
jgi:hypothetical protein